MVRESLCAPDIELLSVSLRPFYLPREFTQLFVTLVYIHPKANMDNAVQAITRTVLQLQAMSPDAPSFIMGDFDNCKPGKYLGNIYQYVTCVTRLTKCLDLCYGSIKGAYKSLRRASLGMSDHNTVYLGTQAGMKISSGLDGGVYRTSPGLLCLHRLGLVQRFAQDYG